MRNSSPCSRLVCLTRELSAHLVPVISAAVISFVSRFCTPSSVRRMYLVLVFLLGGTSATRWICVLKLMGRPVSALRVVHLMSSSARKDVAKSGGSS